MNNKNKNGGSQRRYGRSDADQKARSQSQYARYMAQGRDAAAHGDKVEAERNFQYAEHYLRMLNNGRDSASSAPKEAVVPVEEEDVLGAFPSTADENTPPERDQTPKRRARAPRSTGESSDTKEPGLRTRRPRRKAEASESEK